jgi:hypothetical protein
MTTAQKEKTVAVLVDNETVTGVPQHTTPDAILEKVAVDPSTHYLVRISGREQHSYDGKGNEAITVHEDEKFVTVSTGPTPTA